MKPGQWLDLAVAVACALYAACVVAIPSLADLAAFASPEAAGLMAAAAFARFSNSLRSIAPVAALGLVLLAPSGCAQLQRLEGAADAYCDSRPEPTAPAEEPAPDADEPAQPPAPLSRPGAQ